MRIIGNDPSVPRQTQEIASGTLSTGDTVIVNSDGTVSVISETSVSAQTTTPTTFTTNTIQNFLDAAYDSGNDRVVVVYSDGSNSNYGTAVVGTVSSSDNSITFGTPVVFDSLTARNTVVAYDANAGKVVVAYYGFSSPNTGLAIVGTVSGSSISFGSRVTMNATGPSQDIGIVYAPDQQKIVCSYRDQYNSSYGTAIVGTVSGTSISFGTEVVFNSGTTYQNRLGYDTTKNRVLCAYRDNSNSNYGTIIAGTVSGTSITFGSEAEFHNSSAGYPKEIVHDSVNNINVIVYGSSVEYGLARTVSIDTSDNSLTFGTAAQFKGNSIGSSGAAGFNAAAGKIDIIYKDEGDSNKAKFVTATVSGTSISYSSETTVDTNQTDFFSVVYNTTLKNNFIAYSDETNTQGEAFINQLAYTETNLTAENYIGTAKSGAADGDGVVVNTQGNVADIPVSNYNISSASYDSATLDVSSQEGSPRGMAFNSDGTKVYVVGTFSDNLSQYNCSTAYDISTASYSGTNFSFASQDTQPHDIVFNNDGTKLYMIGLTNDTIFRYSLSSAYDISTLSYDSVSFSVGSQATSPRGLTFGSNGNKLYVSDQGNDRIYEYDLSTAYDATTATYNSVNFDPTSEETNPSNVAFDSAGTKMFIAGNTTVYQYSLSTAFDISTASYDSVSFDTSSQVIDSYDIHFNPDGSKMYIVDIDNTALFQYSTSVALTAGQSYYVQTDGTLSTTAGDPSVFAGTAVSATKLIVKG